MATSSNAQISYEAGQNLVAFHTLTTSDNLVFTSASKPWSMVSGKEPEIVPNGLVTGGTVSVAASGSNNVVDVAALTCYLAGVLTTVNADTDVTVTRATATDTHIINSITVDSTGAIAVVAGVDSTAFSETRGANGGPPFIPVGSIEIAQVRLTSNTAAVVASSEIFQVIGQHTERFDFPVWSVNPIKGEVTFNTAFPLIHTGSTPKRVYAKVYIPIFATLGKTDAFVPAENSYSTSSTQIYGGTVGSSTQSLSAASFTAYLEDGHTDPFLALVGENILVKFKSNRNRNPYSLTQGKMGFTRAYPNANQNTANVTIAAENPTVDFTG